LTVTCTGSTSPWLDDGRFSAASRRLVEKALLLTAATVSRSTCGSANQSKKGVRDMLRRDRPRTFSNDELANSHSPSGVTTATIVASRSSAACAAAGAVGDGLAPGPAGAITGASATSGARA
jgi:hypothetical protein